MAYIIATLCYFLLCFIQYFYLHRYLKYIIFSQQIKKLFIILNFSQDSWMFYIILYAKRKENNNTNNNLRKQNNTQLCANFSLKAFSLVFKYLFIYYITTYTFFVCRVWKRFITQHLILKLRYLFSVIYLF